MVGGNFSKAFLLKFDGWNYDKVVSYYVDIYKYTFVQVINIFEIKIQNREIILNEDKTLTI